MGQSGLMTTRSPRATVIFSVVPRSLAGVRQTWQCETTCAIARRTVFAGAAPPPGAASSASAATSGTRCLRFIERLLQLGCALRRTRREPPVPAAEERHQRRYEQRADERRIDEDGKRQTEAELLQPRHAADDEAAERDRHHERGRSDETAGPLESERDGAGVVVPRVPLLAHPRNEKHLVVHREPEQRREEEDRDPGVDLGRALNA